MAKSKDKIEIKTSTGSKSGDVVKSPKSRGKLATASVQIVADPTQNAYVFTRDVDRMEIPKTFNKLIEVCRFFYRQDPIAGTIINKLVDMSVSELKNMKSTCTDEEIEVFNGISDMLQSFYRNVCLEYLLSGLVVPHYEWVQKRGSDLSNKLNSRRRVWVPDNIWFRDPSTIRIEQSPIPNVRWYYVKISRDMISFIKSSGKRKDGTYDKQTYQALLDNYPAFVAKVKALKGTSLEVELTDIRPILGRTLPENAYPIPYMSNALESLMHKRNLRKMDYSIASRVTAAIQLIKIGNDLFPCKDEGDFEQLKTQMNYQNMYGESERIFQLFGNHTLEITWVFPETEAMLNDAKYSTVNDDIIAGFGFPRTLITGETLRSNVSGGADFATSSPIATMTAIRDILIEWTKELYTEIRDRNDFKGKPIPRFEPMKLYKLLDISQIGQFLYQEGSLSRTSRLEAFGYDIDTELERKEMEKVKYKEHNIEDAPLLPFSSPQIGQPKPDKEPNKEPKKEE